MQVNLVTPSAKDRVDRRWTELHFSAGKQRWCIKRIDFHLPKKENK